MGYGSALALSRLTYDHGVTPSTLVLLRYVALSVALGAWLAMTRKLRLPRLSLLASMLLVGVLSYIITFANLSAILYIPVSLTTIIFYTHPALVVLATAAAARSRVNGVELAAVGAAFCGLFVALEVSFDSLHPLGLGFAGVSALTVATLYLISNRLLDSIDFVEITFYMALGATALAVLALLVQGGWTMPQSTTGLALVVLVTVIFMLAITFMFLAIELIGSVPTSMLTNVEPLTAIAVAVMVLGEPLPFVVAFGAVIVVAALLLMQASRARSGASESARTKAGRRPRKRRGARDPRMRADPIRSPARTP